MPNVRVKLMALHHRQASHWSVCRSELPTFLPSFHCSSASALANQPLLSPHATQLPKLQLCRICCISVCSPALLTLQQCSSIRQAAAAPCPKYLPLQLPPSFYCTIPAPGPLNC